MKGLKGHVTRRIVYSVLLNGLRFAKYSLQDLMSAKKLLLLIKMTKPQLHMQTTVSRVLIESYKQTRLTLKTVQPTSFFQKPISQSVIIFFDFAHP